MQLASSNFDGHIHWCGDLGKEKYSWLYSSGFCLSSEKEFNSNFCNLLNEYKFTRLNLHLLVWHVHVTIKRERTQFPLQKLSRVYLSYLFLHWIAVLIFVFFLLLWGKRGGCSTISHSTYLLYVLIYFSFTMNIHKVPNVYMYITSHFTAETLLKVALNTITPYIYHYLFFTCVNFDRWLFVYPMLSVSLDCRFGIL